MIPHPDATSRPAGILIVDDDAQNRRLLELMLAEENFRLQTAASGDEALTMVAQEPPDLILLDVMMPGMDGHEVARRLKGNIGTRNIPIIMITALDSHHDRMFGLDAGAEDFLTKPVDRAELRMRVRNLLRLKSHGDHYDKYSRILEGEIAVRTADLVERTNRVAQQASVLSGQAALLELAQEAIIVRGMDGRITFWNRGAEVMYGWAGEEALGRNVSELLKTEPCDPTADVEATLLRDGQWAGEVRQHERGGKRLVVASRWALQCDAGGVPIRILTIDSDITDRKQVASELLLLTELERTSKDQLRLRDEFLSHVSHELRSPLTAIKQFTTILLGGLAGELNAEQSQYQKIVLKNVEQLQSMIDDLLEVTRLGTGKLSVELVKGSLPEAAADTLNTVQVTAKAKGVVMSCHVPENLPAIHADPTRLRQVLLILLDNAIKFTPAGGVVRVRAGLMEQDPHFVHVEVSDTGCGISPEETARIFDRLYQGAVPGEASRKGLGLGLYICKELVTRQGGELWVKSQHHEGSSFSFTIPVFSVESTIALPRVPASDGAPVETMVADMATTLEEPIRSRSVAKEGTA